MTNPNATYLWSPGRIDGQKLEKLRLEGDSHADEALPFIRAGEVVNSILEPTNPAVKVLHDQVTLVPPWVNYDQIKRGQTLFWSYQPLCMGILLNASLVGGFGAKRVASTLQCTNYLGNKETVWRRMVETAMMVQDVMSFGALQVGGKGWRSALEVRMMHAQVRSHVLRLSKYDREANGIPINQEDLLTTLMVFSTTVIYSLRRMGVSVSEEEAEDFIAAWRYVGHILGIQHLHHFKSYKSSLILRESVLDHLLDPDEISFELANNVIQACQSRPPLFLSKKLSSALTRRLLGHEWADKLQLPHSGFHLGMIDLWIGLIHLVLYLANTFCQSFWIHRIQRASYNILWAQLGTKAPSYNFAPIKSTRSKGATPDNSNPLVLISILAIILITFLNLLVSNFISQL